MKPTFLVTGGSGFIGTWVLKELLRRESRVVVFDVADGGERWQRILGSAANRLELVRGDLLDESALNKVLEQHAVTHVIHLAAWLTPMCQENPYRGCEINVLGTMRLFEWMRTHAGQIKGFAYASSIAVYGPENDEPRSSRREEALTSQSQIANRKSQIEQSLLTSAATEPTTFYGAFKRANELIAQQYWLHHRLPSVGLRPSLVFGPGRETGSTAGPTLAARAAALGESFTFSFSGAASYAYVEDTARAFVRAAGEVREGGHAVDLPGHATTVEEVIRILDELRPGAAARLFISGPALPYPVRPRQSPIERLFPDWVATPLAEGFRKTVEYYTKGGKP